MLERRRGADCCYSQQTRSRNCLRLQTLLFASKAQIWNTRLAVARSMLHHIVPNACTVGSEGGSAVMSGKSGGSYQPNWKTLIVPLKDILLRSKFAHPHAPLRLKMS